MRIIGGQERGVDDLDSILGRLAHAPGHPGLDGLESRLVARIAADRRDRDLPLGAAIATIALVLGIGVASGHAAVGHTVAGSVALDAGLDLAPSTRLVAAG